MAEYRPVPDDRVDEFVRIVRYAFRPGEPVESTGAAADLPPPATLSDRRGLFEAGTLCCTGAHYWFTLDVRGEPRAVAGLSAVATPPHRRRQGLVRQLLGEALAEYRDRGIGFAALWPFEHAFYRRHGWALASRYARTTCPPSALAVADGGAGSFVELTADRWRDLAAVYEVRNDHGLAMHRAEAWWRKRAFAGWKRDPYVYGWERDGDLRGYVRYRVLGGDRDRDDRQLAVHELAYVDEEAHRNLLRFCSHHDTQVGTVRIYGPPDVDRFDLTDRPGDVERTVHAGPMLRIVDVETALGSLAYPEGADASVTIAVSDDFAPWNDGTFELTVADGAASCEPTDGEADAETDVNTLAQLAVGYHPVERAREVGGLSTTDATAARLADLLPPEETFLREWF